MSNAFPCQLCIKHTENYKSIYDEEGKENKMFEMASKYFKLHELENLIGSKVICEDCWKHIEDFHTFQEKTNTARKQYEQFLKTEKIVKVEVNIDEQNLDIPFEDCFKEKLEIDPVGISDEINDVLDDYNNVSNTSSDDDEPLMSRIRRKVKKTQKQSPTKYKRKIKPSSTPLKNIARKPSNKVEGDAFIKDILRNDLQCDLCPETCETFSSMRNHFRKQHSSEKTYVVCCRRKYFHRIDLIEHLQLHINPEKFQCTICLKCSKSRRGLATHMKTMHSPTSKDRIFQCTLCPKSFAKRSILRSHMETHATGNPDFKCLDCGKGFVLKSRLNIHIRNVHSTAYHGVCELCGKSFRNKYYLRQHLMEHEGVKKQQWPCDSCDAKLNSKYSLKRHNRLYHMAASTVYVCSECGKVALNADALRSHKKYVHQKERKYKCNICDKAFKVALVLKEHMTTHTGEDLYECPHCPKKFKVNANMHHHRKRVHPKEWEANRQRRTLASNVDLSKFSNEVIL